MVTTYGALYRQTARCLEPVEGMMASQTARELLAHVTGKPQAMLMAMQSQPVPETVVQACQQAADRILAGEPLAYILGQWDFYGLHLTVTPEVLIPRDDTMAVVDLALEEPLPNAPQVLDLCTGSGCIGLAVAHLRKDACVTLADLSDGALRVAAKNAATLGLSERVTCVKADAMAPAAEALGRFDLIISNPPYITKEEMRTLQPSVRDYEPHMALDGGEDGLDFYRAITKNYGAALKPGGLLAMEFGQGQAAAVCGILEAAGYEVLRTRMDTGRITRAVLAKRKKGIMTNGEEEG